MPIDFLDSLTVYGSVSSSSKIYGEGSSITNILNVSGGTLYGGLTGTDAVFNYFYGDGSNLTNISATGGNATDTTKLHLSGGTLTGNLSGPSAYFDNLSSNNFYARDSILVNTSLSGSTAYITDLSAANLSVQNGFINNLSASSIQSPLFVGDLTISGNLTASGTLTVNNTTVFTATSALSVVNLGPGPALFVEQGRGSGDIASFYDADGVEALHVGNAKNTVGQDPNGVIGIKTSFPNKALTVVGEISATDNVTTDGRVTANGATLNDSLSGTYAIFSQYVNAVSLSGTHRGWGGELQGLVRDTYTPMIETTYSTVSSLSANWNTAYARVTALNIDRKQVVLVGDAINNIFSISHNIAAIERLVQVFDTTNGHQVYTGIDNKDPYITRVAFSFVPSLTAYKVVIVG